MARKTTKRAKTAPAKTAAKPPSRREAMTRMGWYGLGGAAVLGVGGCSAPIKMRNYANQVRNRRDFPGYLHGYLPLIFPALFFLIGARYVHPSKSVQGVHFLSCLDL